MKKVVTAQSVSHDSIRHGHISDSEEVYHRSVLFCKRLLTLWKGLIPENFDEPHQGQVHFLTKDFIRDKMFLVKALRTTRKNG